MFVPNNPPHKAGRKPAQRVCAIGRGCALPRAWVRDRGGPRGREAGASTQGLSLPLSQAEFHSWRLLEFATQRCSSAGITSALVSVCGRLQGLEYVGDVCDDVLTAVINAAARRSRGTNVHIVKGDPCDGATGVVACPPPCPPPCPLTCPLAYLLTFLLRCPSILMRRRRCAQVQCLLPGCRGGSACGSGSGCGSVSGAHCGCGSAAASGCGGLAVAEGWLLRRAGGCGGLAAAEGWLRACRLAVRACHLPCGSATCRAGLPSGRAGLPPAVRACHLLCGPASCRAGLPSAVRACHLAVRACHLPCGPAACCTPTCCTPACTPACCTPACCTPACCTPACYAC